VSKVKILLVEDGIIEAKDIKLSLESYNYEVSCIALNDDEVLDNVFDKKPDIILMDEFSNGQIDSFEITKKIHELNIPVIFLTAEKELSNLLKSKLINPYGYIIKPYSPIDLRNSIEFALYKHEMDIKLKKTEIRHRNVLTNIQDGYIRADNEGIILMASPSAANMFRYNTPEEMVGISAFSLYKNPETRQLIVDQLKTDKKLDGYEIEGLRKDGSTFWISLNSQLYTEQGRIQGTESFLRDITEHRTAEKRINKLYRLYATLSQINQAVVRIKDRNALFKTICEVCVKFGQFKMAWIGLINPKTGNIQPVEYYGDEEGYLDNIKINLHDPNDHPTINAINSGDLILIGDIKKELNRDWCKEAIKRNYHSLASIPIKLKDKPIGILNIYSSETDFFTGEEIDLIKEMAMDVSFAIDSIEIEKERTMFEKSLIESEKKFKALINNSSDLIRILDKNRKIIFDSPSSERILGYPQGSLIGKDPLEFIHSDDLDKVNHDLIEVYDNRNHGLPTEFRIKKADGTYLPVESISQNMFDIPGINGIVVTTHPIKERKEMENQIRSSLKEKEILIKEIHHRVKNNMQIISSLLNLQKQYVEEEEAINVLQESQNRVKTMSLIHEKLYQSKDLTHINIADYIKNLITDLFYSYAMEKEDIQQILEINDTDLNIETALPCGLIISEIISNSLKYAFPDKKGGIFLSLKRSNDKFSLLISDNGIGFPEDIDFKNSDSLGLQLVNNLVGQLDGEIQLDNSEGTKYQIIFQELNYKNRF